jgi:precorrin-8X/cobalt-precorrin-8 methylmutase
LKTAILLLGHGSPRDEANKSLERTAAMVKAAGGYGIVIPAYLQFAQPDFQNGVRLCVEKGAEKIILMPYFLYMGAHVSQDLPSEMEEAKGKYPDVEMVMTEPLGEHGKLAEIVVERIAETVGSPEFGVRSNPSIPPLVKGGFIAPDQIEKESFRIIDETLRRYNLSELEYPIVRRVIHTTTDFEYATSMLFSKGAVEAGVDALKKGCPIVTDVDMVRSGILKSYRNKLGIEVFCHISDEDVIKEAKEKGVTRATIAMRKAKGRINGGIVAIGNAPTALYELIRLSKEEGIRPALVVGMPVGFVGAAESKAALASSDLNYITNRGTKGGSTVTAAAVNALMIMAS